MARFGKQAELDAQKGTKDVECIVSVSDDNCYVDSTTGKATRYFVEAQRLQDEVSPEDAKAGKADSNPYITSHKEYYRTLTGEVKEKVSHVEQISAYGMEQIKAAAANEFDTIKKVFDAVTGEEKEKIVHNYIVKLNIGFQGPGKPAFFYVPKAVNVTEKDEKYSFRNMPKRGRELTQAILDKHNEITQIAKEAAREKYANSDNKESDSTSEIKDKSTEENQDIAQELIQESGQDSPDNI